MLRTMVLATLLGSFLLAQGARIRQQSNNQIRISYSLPKTNLGLHEPVLLTFLVSNDSAKAAVLDLGQDRKGGYIIAVAAPGRPSIELPQYSREGISRIGTISLKPGESFSQQLILNQWYDFPTPGEYKLEARLIQPVIISNDSEVADSGFRGTIEVGPRDELQ